MSELRQDETVISALMAMIDITIVNVALNEPARAILPTAQSIPRRPPLPRGLTSFACEPPLFPREHNLAYEQPLFAGDLTSFAYEQPLRAPDPRSSQV